MTFAIRVMGACAAIGLLGIAPSGTNDDTLTRILAEARFYGPYADGPIAIEHGTVERWPAALTPLLAGAAVIGAVTRTAPADAELWESIMYVDVPARRGAVASDMRSRLTAAGYRELQRRYGFEPFGGARGDFCDRTGSRYLSARIDDLGKGAVRVTLTLSSERSEIASCTPDDEAEAMSGLPVFDPPDGVRYTAGSWSGRGQEISISGTAVGATSVAALSAALGGQMTATGWHRRLRDVNARTATLTFDRTLAGTYRFALISIVGRSPTLYGLRCDLSVPGPQDPLTRGAAR